MARYLITETIRTDCAPPGSRTGGHVSSVVLDRGGAYLVSDIGDFMDHGHSFVVDRGADRRRADRPEPVTRTRCRHCGRPTLDIAVDPAERNSGQAVQQMDAASAG